MDVRNVQHRTNDFSKFGNTILKRRVHRSKEIIDVFDIGIEKII